MSGAPFDGLRVGRHNAERIGKTRSFFLVGLLAFAGLTATDCSGGATGSGGGGATGGGTGTGGGAGGTGAAGGGAGQNDGGLGLKVACTVLNARKCEYLQRCGLLSELGVRDCLAWLQATSCGPTKWPARVEAPVATLRYDPFSAEACAAAYQTRACTDYGSEPAACVNLAGTEKFVLPNTQNGQDCFGSYTECIDPANNACRGATCPFKCQPRGDIGDDCRVGADCKGTDLFCRISNLTTGTGKCTRFGQPDAGCDAEQPCASSLVCYSGRCEVPPTAPNACLGSFCDPQSWCQTGADGGVCKPRADQNGACTDDVQCLPGLLCEVLTGKCVARTLNTVGAACGLRQTCPAGTICLHATPTSLGECQPPLDAGAGCMSSNDCQAHLACIGLDGGLALGCGPRQLDGMRCAENRDCQALSICKAQKCTRRPTTGDSCTETQSCLFGPCVATDAGAICTEPFGPGVVCMADGDCGSGRCVIGKCLPACTP